MSDQRLAAKLEELRVARELLAEAETSLKDARAQWEAQHAAETAEVKQLKANVSKLTEDAGKLGVSAAAVDGRYPLGEHGGIEIKQATVFKYDEVKAEHWCRDHKLYIVVDMKAFDEHVRATHKRKALRSELPFVTVQEQPKAYIAGKIPPLVAAENLPPAVADVVNEEPAAGLDGRPIIPDDELTILPF